MKFPFIFLYKTYKGQYIYDINTNTIVGISNILWEELKRREKDESYRICEEAEKQLLELQEIGLLSDKHWDKIVHPATQILPFYLEGSLSSIVLQITQVCNLNCSYCPFAQGNYYGRKHSEKQMTKEIATKAIDFLVQHATSSKKISVGFYGGEPLVNFETVKYVIDYIINKYPHKEFTYFMTTNATLLDDEKIKFLKKYNFNLTISLDGPKEIHDKNRQSFSQESSFDKVMHALDIICKKYPEFCENISFNCVIDPAVNFDCFHSFFTSYKNIGEYYCRFNEISKENLIEDNYEISKEYSVKYNFEVFKCILSHIGKISQDKVSPIVKDYIDDILQTMFDKRKYGKLGETGHPGGPCIPGGRKIFVNVEGDIFPCEKIDETSENMKIGNIYTGFDLEKCTSLLNVAHLTENECKNCWACRLCYLCCLYCEKNGKMSRETRLGNCEEVKNNLYSYFEIYSCLMEHDYDRNLKWFKYINK